MSGMRDLVVSRHVVVPAHELSWRFSRPRGPGGQAGNTSDTTGGLSVGVAETSALSALLRERAMDRLANRLVDGVLTVSASEHRSQLRNREAALARMAEALRHAIAPPAPSRKRTSPSRTARERRLTTKRHRGEIKRLRGSRYDD